MAALISTASITRWLGRNTPACVPYPVAAAGLLLAVYSRSIAPAVCRHFKRWPLTATVDTFMRPLL